MLPVAASDRQDSDEKTLISVKASLASFKVSLFVAINRNKK